MSPSSSSHPLRRGAPPDGRPSSRRRRIVQRALPMLAAGFAAFGAGALVGAGAHDESVAERYVDAWARGDYAAMHALLAPASRTRWPLGEFARRHEAAARTATLRGVGRAGPAARAGRLSTVPVTLDTAAFGRFADEIDLPLAEVPDGSAVSWGPHLAFPGLRAGEELRRETIVPARGELQAADGTTLAAGPLRSGELAPLDAEVVGRVGPIPAEAAAEYAARGYPPDAMVGLTGLELHFEERLRGRLGGRLLAGGRTLVQTEARPGATVRTSVQVGIQRASVRALAGRLGGVAVIRPGTGEVLALAGLATAAPQPPGSVFKIVTLAAALEAGTVEPGRRYPVRTAAVLSGVELENAHGEACGGTLANSFAHSCNSVFAPMGAELGAERLVEAAERFGFNEELGVAGAAQPSIPPADEIGDELAVGSSAIGQGRLLSTPLHMAAATAAIAAGGTYSKPVLLKGATGPRRAATTRRVARTIGRFMQRTVSSGTGQAAAIPGVRVAGKTGTAELRDSTPELEPGAGAEPVEDDPADTTAWFVAYAPARRPALAVAVMLVGAGAGGDTAAPAAREVLLSALGD